MSLIGKKKVHGSFKNGGGTLQIFSWKTQKHLRCSVKTSKFLPEYFSKVLHFAFRFSLNLKIS